MSFHTEVQVQAREQANFICVPYQVTANREKFLKPQQLLLILTWFGVSSKHTNKDRLTKPSSEAAFPSFISAGTATGAGGTSLDGSGHGVAFQIVYYSGEADPHPIHFLGLWRIGHGSRSCCSWTLTSRNTYSPFLSLLAFLLSFRPALMCTLSACSTGLPWYSFPLLHIYVHYFNWNWRSLKSHGKRFPSCYRCYKFAIFLLHYSRASHSLLVSQWWCQERRSGWAKGSTLSTIINILDINTYISHVLQWLSLNTRQAVFTREVGHDDQGSNQDSLI